MQEQVQTKLPRLHTAQVATSGTIGHEKSSLISIIGRVCVNTLGNLYQDVIVVRGRTFENPENSSTIEECSCAQKNIWTNSY